MKPLQKLFRLFILIGCLTFIPPLTQAAGPPLPLDEYWQKVEQTQTLVAGLENTSDEASRTRLSALAGEWESITQVALPDGTLISVDHSFLVSQLRANPPDPARLNELLTTLLAARDTWPLSKHSTSDLKTLESILAQPEFQWRPEQPSPLAVLWQKILDFLWELISPWLPEDSVITLDSSGGGSLLMDGSWFRYLLTTMVTLILALVLFFIFREMVANLVVEMAIAPDSETGEEILTAETAFKRAQGLSGTGDYRTAVRYLYLSSLLLLDERGLLRYDRSQTNREYLRHVAHLPKLVSILGDVINIFDRVWYGYQALDEETYNQYAARVAELRRQK